MTRRPVSDAEIAADVERVYLDDPTASANQIAREVRHRRSAVLGAVRVLRDREAASDIAGDKSWYPFGQGGRAAA